MDNKVSGTLQRLVFGDRNIFIFNENIEDLPLVSKEKIAKYLVKLNKAGYAISNPNILFDFTKNNLKEFKKQFTNLVSSNTKDGLIFRKTFADKEELSEYTQEEWKAILAQYSITYGWANDYQSIFSKSAESVLNEYVGSFDLETINKLDNSKIKTFTIGDNSNLLKVVKNILESKSVLRSQQIETLKVTPTSVLIAAARESKIIIKETLVLVMKLLSKEQLDFAILKTPTDVLRFIVSSYTSTPIEGQINKALLKRVRIKIPTSMRKSLLSNLEIIAEKRAIIKNKTLVASSIISNDLVGSRYLCEDMFSYSDFWKIIAKYLRFEKAEKSKVKFPLYTKAIDLLYENDRSWTFNGRYSEAKERLNYEDAILVAKERPGFLLRNIIEFIRMTKGTKLPVKIGTEVPLNNAFQNALTKSNIVDDSRTIKMDAIEFLLSEHFENILDKSANTKLAWQLIEK